MKEINVSKWKSFKIGDLFNIKRPIARSVKKYDDGDIPFVSSGNFNNGIHSYKSPLNNEILDKGNCITISPVDGSCFYQNNNFLGRGGGGSSIILLYNENLNKNNSLFIVTVVRNILKYLYEYKDMGNSETIKNVEIKLPVNKNGEPDWYYMESFMKNIEISEKKRVQIVLRSI